eukprot:gene1645-3184_t
MINTDSTDLWDDNNIYSPWSFEEDSLLYTSHKAGKSIEDICIVLRRGYNGISARLKHIKDPNHKAYQRLFGSYSFQDDDFDNILVTKTPLRPCSDAIERILWDPTLDTSHFTFIYDDRFNGLQEAPFDAPNKFVKGKERKLVKAIPEHRIEAINGKQYDEGMKLDVVIQEYDTWLIQQQRVLKTDETAKTMQIFVVLEGVLADFDRAVLQLFKRKSTEISPKVLWSRISANESFYTSMPVAEGASRLWRTLSKSYGNVNVTVTVISPSTRNKTIDNQKQVWFQKHFATATGTHQQIEFYGSQHEKTKCYATLLSRRDWEEAGGKFILHENIEDTLGVLRRELDVNNGKDNGVGDENENENERGVVVVVKGENGNNDNDDDDDDDEEDVPWWCRD